MRISIVAFWALAAILLPARADVNVPIQGHWVGGFQGEACFDITTEMNGWTVTLTFSEAINSLEAWIADVSQKQEGGKVFVLTNKDFNAAEHPGDRLCIGFMGHGNGDISPTVTAHLDGDSSGPISQHVTVAPVSLAPGQTTAPTTTTTRKPLTIPSGDGYHADVAFKQDFGSDRFEASLSFPLGENINGWLLNISFDKPVTNIQQYLGDAIYTSPDGYIWTLVNQPHADKSEFQAGTTFELKFTASYTGGLPHPKGTAVLVNMGVDPWRVDEWPATGNSKYNYNDVLYKSILFYEAQRSGKLPPTNRIPWRGDSALGDKGDNGEDLTGGWYDAGDHVKFNFPMAYTTTALAWGYLEFKDAYEDAGQKDWLLDCIKWPLDYLIKCHTGPNELYVQVGDAGADHGYWGAPEMMTMARPAFKITASKPGSDMAMEAAAAMAAGYLAFKDEDPSYADTLLDHAKQLWEFGDKHPGKYSASVTQAAGFYSSNNETDESCWGSLWLYKATGEQKYLDNAEQLFDPEPAWGQSWDEKTIGNQVLLYQATKKDNYKRAIENSFKNWLPGGDVSYTPKGLAYRLQWGSLRYSSNMALAFLVAAESGIQTEEMRHWAMCQIHYVLGDTGFSYVIGFGDDYPLHPHHRSSSCPRLPAQCGSYLGHSKEPNVHLLYGAMVGGPGGSDDYEDSRENYVNNEVACDYNSGIQGAVAGLKHLYLIGEHPEQTGSDSCPYR